MLYVVGIGPGGADQIAPRAVQALNNSDLVVGYTKYIELIQNLIDGKEVMSTGMKSEVERCRYAVEKALAGNVVSVVSSGDAGIYGMAGLIYELAEPYPELCISVIPGITAANSAAAVLGAPLMNDFAVISLSDLLTDWQVIERRLHAAAAGDFAIALYNPSSKKRSGYLKNACEIILQYQEATVPCGFVKNIGRDGEQAEVCTLKELSEKNVDMFTTVIIGNSRTKIINGKLVTPRGYHHEET